jgi:hypothetical protein
VDIGKTTVSMTAMTFLDFRISTIPKAHADKICVKSGLLCDFENFNFFDLEILRTRENDVIVQAGVVRLSVAKESGTEGVCVALIGNNNVRRRTTKVWTGFEITIDCLPFH